jgi:hypothetical protein
MPILVIYYGIDYVRLSGTKRFFGFRFSSDQRAQTFQIVLLQ